jgi:hypothetical protein
VIYQHWVSPQLRFEYSTNINDEVFVLLRVKGREDSYSHGDIGRGGQWLSSREDWMIGLRPEVGK